MQKMNDKMNCEWKSIFCISNAFQNGYRYNGDKLSRITKVKYIYHAHFLSSTTASYFYDYIH